MKHKWIEMCCVWVLCVRSMVIAGTHLDRKHHEAQMDWNVLCVCGVCDGYYRHASRQKASWSTNGLKCVALALFLQPTCKLYCRVLPCVAVCCSVLQCVAVCSSVLHCVAACCSDRKMWSWHSSYSRHVLQRVAACCSELQRVAVMERCRPGTSSVADIYVVMQCVAFFCNVLQCVAMVCSVLQRVAACYSMLARARARCGVWQRVAVCFNALPCMKACICISIFKNWQPQTRMNEQQYTYEWGISHIWMRHITRMNGCGTHMNESRLTYQMTALTHLLLTETHMYSVSFAKEPYKRDDISLNINWDSYVRLPVTQMRDSLDMGWLRLVGSLKI